ncbi:uncharacterized protein [Dysidea avara]|uniref:uncharacterized protein isoform X2 n=1 Tax=Dysidea avara TaxID=196820 RepID=UPI00332DA571
MGLAESRPRSSFSSPRVRFTPLKNESASSYSCNEISMESMEVSGVHLRDKAAANDDDDLSSEEEDDSKEHLTSDIISDEAPPLLSRWRLVVLNIGWFGTFYMYLFLSLQIVPAQLRAFVGDGAKAKDLGFLVAGGGLLTLLVSPAVGLASDRLRFRYGRRRPFMVVGTGLVILFLLGCALVGPHDESVLESNVNKESNKTECYNAHALMKRRCNFSDDSVTTKDYHSGKLGLYITFYLLGMGSYTCATMPYSGLVADMTHPSLRGFASGVMGALQLLGSLFAAVTGAFVPDIGFVWAFVIIMLVFGGSMGISVFSVTERKILTTPPKLKFTTVLAAYVEPLKNWDFFWVFFTRFLMQMGVGTALGFLQYWVEDMIVLPKYGGSCMSPITAVSILFLPLLIVAAIFSVLGGIASDKLKRRKVLVITAAFSMAVGAGLAAGLPYFVVAAITAVLFGAGFGTYLSVDFALLMDVLKNKQDHAKDIAVWHQALVLPQTFATLIGGLVVSTLNHSSCEHGLGYIVLFILTALYFFLSALFVTCIKKVR